MGTHTARKRSIYRAAAVTTATATVAIFCYGTAFAAPGDAPSTQGDLSTDAPSSQGDLNSDAPSSQGELTVTPPAPEPPAERVYWAPPPPQYDNTEWQNWDAYYNESPSYTPQQSAPQGGAEQGSDYYSGDFDYAPEQSAPAAPLDLSTLHAPTAVAPSAPVAAPPKVVKIGEFYDDQPNWMSDNVLERTNNTTAVIQAQVTDGWRSIGVPTDRAQRLAASQVALGGAGLVTGALGAAVPAATVGGLIGGTVGGIAGATAGGLIPVAPGIAPITTGVAGTAIGAGVGAAVAAVPAAVVGGAAGLATGLAAGTTYGAGDLSEPQKVELPEFDEPTITEQTEQVVEAVEAVPGGSEAVSTWTEPQTPLDDARDFVATQPGGADVLTAVDQAGADFAKSDFAPAADVIGGAIAAAFAPPAPATAL